jgi:hypothetical protein
MHADMHRQFIFLARPEQGKTACPSGKQFYIFYNIVGGLYTLKKPDQYYMIGVFNREAIDRFCPVRSTGQKNKVRVRLR